MAVDMFINLDDVESEASGSKYPESIDVLAWSWGLSQSGPLGFTESSIEIKTPDDADAMPTKIGDMDGSPFGDGFKGPVDVLASSWEVSGSASASAGSDIVLKIPSEIDAASVKVGDTGGQYGDVKGSIDVLAPSWEMSDSAVTNTGSGAEMKMPDETNAVSIKIADAGGQFHDNGFKGTSDALALSWGQSADDTPPPAQEEVSVDGLHDHQGPPTEYDYDFF